MAEEQHDGITRIGNVHPPGWLVGLGRDGKTYSRYFADKKYGGKDKALGQALIYRDVLAGMLGATGNTLHHLDMPEPSLPAIDEDNDHGG